MKTTKTSEFLVCVGVVLGLGLGVTVTAAVITVPGDFATIQAAIEDAGTLGGDEIVVAAGTYVVTSPIDFKGKAITLRSASGNPADTILDGQGNAYHIVQCISGEGADTVLSGFTITGGCADDLNPPPDYSNYSGGGMYINGCSPTVTNCLFSGNSAGDGGGMYNNGGNPTVTYCTFSGNSTLDHGVGGGLYNYGGSPTVTHCTFSQNTAHSTGGGMYNTAGGRSTVTHCTFSENTASSGGGMYNNTGSPTVTNCTFRQNSATQEGGGMYNYLYSYPILTNCIFSGNSASGSYGGGGGISNYLRCSPIVINCTFSQNSATAGGAMHSKNLCTPTVANSIFWGNSPDQIFDDFAYSPYSKSTVYYSDVQGGLPSQSNAGGNINADPLFVDADGPDNVAGTADDDLRLSLGSPCIDAGNSVLASAFGTDLAGNRRFADIPAVADAGVGFPNVVDMGAYEYQPSPDPCDTADPADFDCSGTVDLQDFVYFASQWLR